MRIVRQLDYNIWRAFVDQHPQGQIFHTPEMFEVFTRAKGYSPALWAAVRETGEVLALFLPVFVSLKGGIMRHLTTRAVAYGSVLYDLSSEGAAALEMLLRAYVKATRGQALFTELRNLSDLSAVQPLLNACGFVYEDHLDYLIDLDKPVEMIMQSLSRRARKTIRGVIRQGEVLTQPIETLERLAEGYEVLSKTYVNARVPLSDYSLFEAAFEILTPKGMCYCSEACIGDKCVAVSMDLLYKDIAYGWYGGVDREYGNYNPNDLLTWHVLEWAATHGYRVYDFGGAGKPDEEYGVRDFKAKFGGNLVCFGRNVYTHAPLLMQVSKIGYEFYRRLL